VVVSRQTARLKELWEEQKLSNGRLAPAFIEGSLTEGGFPGARRPDAAPVYGWRDFRLAQTRAAPPRPPVCRSARSQLFGPAERRLCGAHRSRHRAVFRAGEAYGGWRRNANTCAWSTPTKPNFTSRCTIRPADALRWTDNRTPTLSRLGSPEWRGVKSLRQGSRARCGRGPARAVCQAQHRPGVSPSSPTRPGNRSWKPAFHISKPTTRCACWQR